MATAMIAHTFKSAYLSIFCCPSSSALPHFVFVYRIYPNLNLTAREILVWHLSSVQNLIKMHTRLEYYLKHLENIHQI